MTLGQNNWWAPELSWWWLESQLIVTTNNDNSPWYRKYLTGLENQKFDQLLLSSDPDSIHKAKRILLGALVRRTRSLVRDGLDLWEFVKLKKVNFHNLFKWNPEVITRFLPQVIDRMEDVTYTPFISERYSTTTGIGDQTPQWQQVSDLMGRLISEPDSEAHGLPILEWINPTSYQYVDANRVVRGIQDGKNTPWNYLRLLRLPGLEKKVKWHLDELNGLYNQNTDASLKQWVIYITKHAKWWLLKGMRELKDRAVRASGQVVETAPEIQKRKVSMVEVSVKEFCKKFSYAPWLCQTAIQVANRYLSQVLGSNNKINILWLDQKINIRKTPTVSSIPWIAA